MWAKFGQQKKTTVKTISDQQVWSDDTENNRFKSQLIARTLTRINTYMHSFTVIEIDASNVYMEQQPQ